MSNPRDAELNITGHNQLGPSTAAAGRDLDKLKTKVEGAGKSSKSMSDKFLGAAKALRGAALVGAAAAAKIGADAVKNASDAQQSIGATQQIFGKYSKAVVATSKGAATAYGLSANQYRESANLIGSLFKNQGVAIDKLAGKTKSVIGLGSDLSAVYGGTAVDAVEALSSAYKGEFDPLEKYGISLKQSTVNAEAFAVAHVKGQSAFNKLSIAQQRAATQQATTNLLMRQGKDALGQFSAQSGTTAEQAQILKARYVDLSAQLGAKLLPILNKVLAAGVKVVAWLTKHQTAALAATVAVGVLAAGVLALNLALLANPFGLVVVAIALLAAGFVAAWKKSQTFRAVMIAVFQGVSSTITGAIDTVLLVFSTLFGVLGHLPGKAGAAFRSLKASADTARSTIQGVQASINGLKSKTVTVKVHYQLYQTGKGPGTAGQGLGVLKGSAGSTFDVAAPGAMQRTGGPTPVTVTAGDTMVNTTVQIDGRTIRSIARTEINGVTSSQVWRARIGRR